MSVGSWAGVTYLRYTVPTSPKKSEVTVHCYDPALSVLVMLVSCSVLLLETFLADQIFCRSYIGSVYRIRSLAVSHSDGKLRMASLAEDLPMGLEKWLY